MSVAACRDGERAAALPAYRLDPSERAHLAVLLEPAVLAAARRIDAVGEGFTVRDLMAELERPVRWVLSENCHSAPNTLGGRARLRYFT